MQGRELLLGATACSKGLFSRFTRKAQFGSELHQNIYPRPGQWTTCNPGRSNDIRWAAVGAVSIELFAMLVGLANTEPWLPTAVANGILRTVTLTAHRRDDHGRFQHS